jgi:hypothetical protein
MRKDKVQSSLQVNVGNEDNVSIGRQLGAMTDLR